MAGSEMSESDKEGEDKQEEGKGKLQRSLKSMLKQMQLCDDEVKYRMENFENADVKKEYLKYLKCTKCNMNFQKVINRGEAVSIHPLLGVLMCDSCCNYYGDGNFSLDSEGEDKYCRWCGEGGTIFACSKCICGFCDECIRQNFGESALETVKNDDDWICYFCNPKPLWYLRSICALANEAARNKRDHMNKTKEGGSFRRKRRKKENADNDTNKTSSDSSSSSTNSSISRKKKTRLRRVSRVNYKGKGDTSSSEDEKENYVNSKKRTGRSKKDSSDSEVKKDSSESESGNPRKKTKMSKEEEDGSEKKRREFLQKLKSIWRLTQTITEVGFNSSKAKLKYLSKYDELGTEKLQKEYDELKSCMNVLTSSLNTASNSVNSIKEDLTFDTTKDETESFRSQEIKLKRFADKFHGGRSDDDVTSVDSEGDSSRREVKRRSEGRKKSPACDGKSKSLRKSVKNNKNNSVSMFSDSGGETGGGEGGLKEDRERGEEKAEKNCDSGKKSDVKPLLKVKSFARMLDANAYDEHKKESDEPIVIEVYDSSESEADGKKSQGDEKNKNQSKGESERKCEGKSENPKNFVNRKEKGKKSTEKNHEISNEETSKEETKKGDGEGESGKQKTKSSNVDNESSENEEGKSSKGKEGEDSESRKKGKIRLKKKDDQQSENGQKDLNEKKKKGSESEHDEGEEKDDESKNQQVGRCDQKESSEEENDKTNKSIEETGDSPKKKSKEGKEKNKNSEESGSNEEKEKNNNSNDSSDESGGEEEKTKQKSDSSDSSSSDQKKQNKRKTRGQKKELKASFEKFKRKRQRFLNSKENTEMEKQNEEGEDKKRTKILESSESETENKNKETEQKIKNRKTKKRRILASSDEENDQKEEEEEEKTSSEESDKVKSESEARKPATGESSTEKEEEEEQEKTKKRKRIQRKQDTDSSEEEKKKKKREKSRSDSSEDEKEKKKTKGRRNIKKILKKDSLQVETKEALENEEERKKRVKERQKLFEELFPQEEGTSKSLILDFNPETKEPLVTVHKKLAKRLKPHQIKGVRFMWDNCFESVQKLEENTGSGCILAHCMGLGKTLQVITLVHTVMTHDLGVNTVLVVCPLSTVSNWIREFEMWLEDVHTDPIMLYDLLKYKKPEERVYQLKNWQEEGGVLVISYDLFRTLTKDLENAGKRKKKRKPKKQQVFESALLDPGPDLVICDEGHLLKNVDTALSKCMNRLKTSRRIVLTGTPLQNNLVEYHCMVQFVKPNILGTRKEFCNRFVNPINNGQFGDSTELDVKIMKRRSHVLHSMLDGCVQRFDYSVLTPFLPEKHEYGVMIALTETQAKAYMYFIDNLSAKSIGSSRTTGLFYDFNCLQRIWTHPRSILMQSERETAKEVCGRDSPGSLKDFVVSTSEEEEEGDSDSESSSVSLQEIPQRKRILRSNANDPEVQKEIEEEEKKLKKRWWNEFYEEKSYDDIRESNKLVILFSLLKYCEEKKDKVLVFSQSLYSLDLIEYFLGKVDENRNENDETLCGHTGRWELGSDYFRLDGSTSSDTRAIWCKYFNKESNTRARLFLISTRAGGLGINLYGANRVVIFDASWNPSHDLQSIFRVYRFGQKKACYIYRFLAEGTMEEKIYERQVTKLSLAHRVVDEHQIERHYTMGNLQELYTFQPTPKEERKIPNVPKDSVLADLLTQHKELIVSYHEHDSLLENKQEEELSEEERKAAWKEYEEEKASKMITYNQMMEQMKIIQQGNMFQGMVDMGAPLGFAGQVNPMYAPSNIPLEVMHRGLRIGVTPLQNETVESFLTRVFQRECWMRAAQQQQQQQHGKYT